LTGFFQGEYSVGDGEKYGCLRNAASPEVNRTSGGAYMGAIMGIYDTHIPSFQQNFNMRFAPEQVGEHAHGGIAEMRVLQQNFKIFQPRRSFADSCKILGLGNHLNNDAKNRWFRLLKWLKECPSDSNKTDGDRRIVSAMIANLKGVHPLPCFMTSHDGNTDPRVIVFHEARPLHYARQSYLTISLPLKPNDREPSEQANRVRNQKKGAAPQKKSALNNRKESAGPKKRRAAKRAVAPRPNQ
jgi:hypothetical protein